MKAQRFVKKETYFGFGSSWHCKEMGEFVKTLSKSKSGIGRKTLKGALIRKVHERAIEETGFLRIRYVFPPETDQNAMRTLCADWNSSHDESTFTFTSDTVNSEGVLRSRVINLDLKGWDIEKEKASAV